MARTHGKAYRSGCRCDLCKQGNTEAMRRYVAMVIERDGISPTQKARPRKDPTYCPDCGRHLPVGGQTCKACGIARRDAHQRSLNRRKRLMAQVIKSAAGVSANPRWPWVQGTCAECGLAFTRRGMVSAYCSKTCSRPERRATRRARKRDAFVSIVYRARIFERDKWHCQLCRKKVNRNAVVPHPKAPVLDHILPLSQGGTHEPANVQLACFMCNAIKSDGLYLGRPEQLSMVG